MPFTIRASPRPFVPAADGCYCRLILIQQSGVSDPQATMDASVLGSDRNLFDLIVLAFKL